MRKGEVREPKFWPGQPSNRDPVLLDQFRALADAGAAEVLNMDRDAYSREAATVWREFGYSTMMAQAGLFWFMYVDYRLPDEFLIRAAGVNCRANLNQFELAEGIKKPDGLQIIQLQVGWQYDGVPLEDVRRRCQGHEVPGILVEGLTCVLYWGTKALECPMRFPGMKAEGNRLPVLYEHRGEPELDLSLSDNPLGYGALTRSKLDSEYSKEM